MNVSSRGSLSPVHQHDQLLHDQKNYTSINGRRWGIGFFQSGISKWSEWLVGQAWSESWRWVSSLRWLNSYMFGFHVCHTLCFYLRHFDVCFFCDDWLISVSLWRYFSYFCLKIWLLPHLFPGIIQFSFFFFFILLDFFWLDGLPTDPLTKRQT